MKAEGKARMGRRDFLRGLGAGTGVAVAAAGPLAGNARADGETNAEKIMARYKETDHVRAFYRVNRYGAMPNSYNDIRNAKTIFFLDGNPTEAHLVSLQHVLEGKEFNRANFIVADPAQLYGRPRQVCSHPQRHRHARDLGMLWHERFGFHGLHALHGCLLRRGPPGELHDRGRVVLHSKDLASAPATASRPAPSAAANSAAGARWTTAPTAPAVRSPSHAR